MGYDHFEHRHRFAVWAGARASQRGLKSATITILREALEHTDIRDFIKNPISLNIEGESFDRLHRKWCNEIVHFLKGKTIEGATFGRAAKFVAIYIKSMIIVGAESNSRLAAVAHPPIDKILLTKLAGDEEIKSVHKPLWRSTFWTKLNEREYYDLLETLRATIKEGDPWWMIEEHWTVTDDQK